MKKAGKPANQKLVKNSSGSGKDQDTSTVIDAKGKPARKSAQKVASTTLTATENRQPKTGKKPAVKSSTRAKAANKSVINVPDLNASGYPLHPNRIWPD